MNTADTPASIPSKKRQLIWNASHIEALTREELVEVLKYTAQLAEFYEGYILGQGIRHIWEADDYIEAHKNTEYSLL